MKSLTRALLPLLVSVPSLAFAQYNVISLGSLGGETIAVDINASGQVTGKGSPSMGDASHTFLYTGGQLLDLGTGPKDEAHPAALNDSGNVVGVVRDYTGPFLDATGAFLYKNGALTDFGFPLSPQFAAAVDINNARQIAVTSGGHAFLYNDSTQTSQDIGTLGGTQSSATAINASGLVVGSYSDGQNSHAFLYTPSASSAVDLVPGFPSRAGNAVQRPINVHGHVAGSFKSTDGLWHAFIYRNGSAIDLGEIGTTGVATSINDSGQVAGTLIRGDGRSRAFIYSNGRITKLPVVAGTLDSQGMSINNAGEVVGMSGTLPVVWSANGTIRIIDTRHLGSISPTVVAINNAGQVVGNYITPNPVAGTPYSYVARAFLATPAP